MKFVKLQAFYDRQLTLLNALFSNLLMFKIYVLFIIIYVIIYIKKIWFKKYLNSLPLKLFWILVVFGFVIDFNNKNTYNLNIHNFFVTQS